MLVERAFELGFLQVIDKLCDAVDHRILAAIAHEGAAGGARDLLERLGIQRRLDQCAALIALISGEGSVLIIHRKATAVGASEADGDHLNALPAASLSGAYRGVVARVV